MTYPEMLHTLPSSVQKNYVSNRIRLRLDIILAFTLVSFCASAYHSIWLIFLPFWGAFFDYLSSLARIHFSPGTPFTPLPSDIRARIAVVVDLPPRTYFWRGMASDCRSISFYFFHIILLPEGFEDKLDQPISQAILHHEFSHDRFFDYLCLFWVLFAVALFIGMIYLQVSEIAQLGRPVGFDADFLNTYFSHAIPFALMIVFCVFNIKGVMYRKELNADFEASFKNPAIYKDFLSKKIRDQKFFKIRFANPLTWLLNKLTHPTYQYRLNFLTGETKTRGSSYIIPSIIMGFCTSFIILSLAVGVGKMAMRGDFSSHAIAGAVFSVIAAIQCAYFFEEAFGRNNTTSLSEKWIILFCMMLGSQFLALGMVLGQHVDFETVGMPLKYGRAYFVFYSVVAVFGVIFGYIQLAFYLWACTRFIGTMYLSVLAILIFAFVSVVHAYVHLVHGFGNPPVSIFVALVMMSVPVMIAVFLEYIALRLVKSFAGKALSEAK